jgi:hypothetical protein
MEQSPISTEMVEAESAIREALADKTPGQGMIDLYSLYSGLPEHKRDAF